ncbi:MAG: Na+/H+ antiporter NhaC family protein, partial [Eisenbergiella sp.]
MAKRLKYFYEVQIMRNNMELVKDTNGSVSVTPEEVTVQDRGTFVITYTVGDDPIHIGGHIDSQAYSQILSTLEGTFNLNPILLLPPVVVLVLIFMRKPTIPVFGIGILLAAVLAVAVQGKGIKEVLSAMTSGLGISTDMALVDSMINRGGLLSMMPSVALIIGAAVFSSALKATGVFQMFLDAIQKYATGRKSLLGFSYLLHLILASFTGVYLVTFSIVGPILGPMFDKYDL